MPTKFGDTSFAHVSSEFVMHFSSRPDHIACLRSLIILVHFHPLVPDNVNVVPSQKPGTLRVFEDGGWQDHDMEIFVTQALVPRMVQHIRSVDPTFPHAIELLSGRLREITVDMIDALLTSYRAFCHQIFNFSKVG